MDLLLCIFVLITMDRKGGCLSHFSTENRIRTSPYMIEFQRWPINFAISNDSRSNIYGQLTSSTILSSAFVDVNTHIDLPDKPDEIIIPLFMQAPGAHLLI